MKKLFAILLTVALLASFAVCAFADSTPIDENDATSASGKDAGSYTIGVSGKYVAGSAAQITVSVDISWSSLEFTYNGGGATYDPGTHTTTIKDQGWSTNKSGITVTNNSNIGIEASFAFVSAANLGIVGEFYTKDEQSDTYTPSADDKITLPSGENTVGEGYTVPTGTIYFGIDSSSPAITTDDTLGTITITIAQVTSTTNPEGGSAIAGGVDGGVNGGVDND